MESDTLNPTHTETRKKVLLGFLSSLSRDGKEEPEQQQKRERHSVFPHDECYCFADTL